MAKGIRITEMERIDAEWKRIINLLRIYPEIIEQQEKLLACYRLQRNDASVGKIIDKIEELKKRRKDNEML